MIRKISTFIFIMLWVTPVFAQNISCTIEYDQQWNLIEDTCVTNNTGYCSSPGGQFRTPKKNNGWCFKTQGNLRGSEVFDQPTSLAAQAKPTIFSWLVSTFIPVVKDQCEDPSKQNNCKLASGQPGHCVGVLGGNKKCEPWAYTRTTKAPPTIPATAGLKPCKPERANNNKSAPECSALPGADGKVRPRSVDKGNGTYSCEEELPKTGDKLCAPQVTLDGKEFACYQVRDPKNYPNIPRRDELSRLCAEEEKKGCDDTDN